MFNCMMPRGGCKEVTSPLARAAAASCRGDLARSSRPTHPSCRSSSPCAPGLLRLAPFQLLQLVCSLAGSTACTDWVQGSDIDARSSRYGCVPWRSRVLVTTCLSHQSIQRHLCRSAAARSSRGSRTLAVQLRDSANRLRFLSGVGGSSVACSDL
jgi:hypothetical protein